MAGLTLNNVGKQYEDGTIAVRDFDLEVEDGEFIVFVGPSGCGKSTTLRMIAGLEEITKGDVFIGDKLVNQLAPSDRNIAMVFQNYALYGHMTTYENIGSSLTLRHQSLDDIHGSVMTAAETVNLTELLNRKPGALSGGQSQRVALGRAIVRDADLFLLDEPLSNLDAKLRVETSHEIIKLHQDLGVTFVYVTHDQIEAMTMADRIVVMDKGVIQQVGSPFEIYNNPTNIFVAGFIGAPPTNFLEGKVENGQFISENVSFNLTAEQNSALTKDEVSKNITLGIRPEMFKSVEQLENLDSDNFESITIVPNLVELLGSHLNVYFDLANSEMIAKIPSTTDEIKAHQELKLLIALDEIYFFDTDTTERIEIEVQ